MKEFEELLLALKYLRFVGMVAHWRIYNLIGVTLVVYFCMDSAFVVEEQQKDKAKRLGSLVEGMCEDQCKSIFY